MPGDVSGLNLCSVRRTVKPDEYTCWTPTFGLFGASYPHIYAPYGEHCAYARTPETFDELIDFEGYDPKTLDRSLMLSLSVKDVQDEITAFCAGIRERSVRAQR